MHGVIFHLFHHLNYPHTSHQILYHQYISYFYLPKNQDEFIEGNGRGLRKNQNDTKGVWHCIFISMDWDALRAYIKLWVLVPYDWPPSTCRVIPIYICSNTSPFPRHSFDFDFDFIRLLSFKPFRIPSVHPRLLTVQAAKPVPMTYIDLLRIFFPPARGARSLGWNKYLVYIEGEEGRGGWAASEI